MNVLFSSLALMIDKIVDHWLFDEVIRTSTSMKAVCNFIQHYNMELHIAISILEPCISGAEANAATETIAVNNILDRPLFLMLIVE